MLRRHRHDNHDDIPVEEFERGSSADWPDPADDPDEEPSHEGVENRERE